jgi:two-component system, OmpR family, response regulator
MMKKRILVAANDAGLRAMLARWLIAAGYSVELAESAKHARRVLANERIGLAIVASDQRDGNDLACELRAAVDRLIVVTAPTNGSMGQAARADGYLSIPLREDDVLAQIDAAFGTETKAVEAAPEPLRFAGYALDAVGRSCLDASGRVVTLTRAEVTLLISLARQVGQAVSRDDLTRAVAGRVAERGDRSVDVLISRLRRKIEADPKSPRIILTIPGVGYSLAAKPPIAPYKTAALNRATETATEAASRRPRCRAKRQLTPKRWRVSPVSRPSF